MPSETDRERRFMGAALERKRKGHPRKGDPKMSEAQLRDFAKKSKKSR